MVSVVRLSRFDRLGYHTRLNVISGGLALVRDYLRQTPGPLVFAQCDKDDLVLFSRLDGLDAIRIDGTPLVQATSPAFYGPLENKVKSSTESGAISQGEMCHNLTYYEDGERAYRASWVGPRRAMLDDFGRLALQAQTIRFSTNPESLSVLVSIDIKKTPGTTLSLFVFSVILLLLPLFQTRRCFNIILVPSTESVFGSTRAQTLDSNRAPYDPPPLTPDSNHASCDRLDDWEFVGSPQLSPLSTTREEEYFDIYEDDPGTPIDYPEEYSDAYSDNGYCDYPRIFAPTLPNYNEEDTQQDENDNGERDFRRAVNRATSLIPNRLRIRKIKFQDGDENNDYDMLLDGHADESPQKNKDIKRSLTPKSTRPKPQPNPDRFCVPHPLDEDPDLWLYDDPLGLDSNNKGNNGDKKHARSKGVSARYDWYIVDCQASCSFLGTNLGSPPRVPRMTQPIMLPRTLMSPEFEAMAVESSPVFAADPALMPSCRRKRKASEEQDQDQDTVANTCPEQHQPSSLPYHHRSINEYFSPLSSISNNHTMSTTTPFPKKHHSLFGQTDVTHVAQTLPPVHFIEYHDIATKDDYARRSQAEKTGQPYRLLPVTLGHGVSNMSKSCYHAGRLVEILGDENLGDECEILLLSEDMGGNSMIEVRSTRRFGSNVVRVSHYLLPVFSAVDNSSSNNNNKPTINTNIIRTGPPKTHGDVRPIRGG